MAECITDFAKEKIGISASILAEREKDDYINILLHFKGVKNFKDKICCAEIVTMQPANITYIVTMNKTNTNQVLVVSIENESRTMAMITFTEFLPNGGICLKTYDKTGYVQRRAFSKKNLQVALNQQAENLFDFCKVYQSSDATNFPSLIMQDYYNYINVVVLSTTLMENHDPVIAEKYAAAAIYTLLLNQ